MLAASEIDPLAAPRATAVRRAPQAQLSVAELSVAELPVADNDNDQREFSAII